MRFCKHAILFLVPFLLILSACGPSQEEPEATGPECAQDEAARCDAGWPTWKLEDVQPESPRFGQTYGLDAFDGQVVLVANLVGWCPYCQSQAVKLEQLHDELEAKGHDIAFVVVHGASANNPEDQLALTSRCTFPILQDTEEANVWGASMGGKDDFFLYAPDGTLLEYLPPSSGTNLSKSEDYAALEAKLIEAATAQ